MDKQGFTDLLNVALKPINERLNGISEQVNGISEQVAKVSVDVEGIKATLEDQSNAENIKRLDKRVRVLEDKSGVVPPSELNIL